MEVADIGSPAATKGCGDAKTAAEGYPCRLCEMALFVRGCNQAKASSLAAAAPGIRSPWLLAKACSS